MVKKLIKHTILCFLIKFLQNSVKSFLSTTFIKKCLFISSIFLSFFITQQSFATNAVVTKDDFSIVRGLSPACTGAGYMRLVEINPRGKIVRNIITYNTKFAYIMPRWDEFSMFFGKLNDEKVNDYLLIKSVLFVDVDAGSDGNYIESLMQYHEDATEFNKKAFFEGELSDFIHKPPIESQSIGDVSGNNTGISGEKYIITVSDPNNGLMLQYLAGQSPYNSIPISSTVVACVAETLKMLITSPKKSNGNLTIFQSFQKHTKTFVSLCIIAFLCTMGIKTIFGQGFAKDGLKTFVFTIIKIGIVSYFALGDAWKDYFLNAIMKILGGSFEIIMKAVNGDKIYDGCLFDQQNYRYGLNVISIFDSMDCKLLFYLGVFEDSKGPVIANLFITFLIFPPVIGPIINTGLTFYVTTIFNINALLVQMYLGGFFYLIMLIFVSSLAMPAMLFEAGVVKAIYDGWLKALMNSILYLILVSCVIAIVLNLEDYIMYGPPSFQEKLFVEHPLAISISDSWNLSHHSSEEAGGAGGMTAKMPFLTAEPLYPPTLSSNTFAKTVSSECNNGSWNPLNTYPVCLLRRISGFIAIPILPFLFEIFTFYIPSPEVVVNVTVFMSIGYACIKLFVSAQIVQSIDMVIKKLAPGATSTSKQLDAVGMSADAGKKTAEQGSHTSLKGSNAPTTTPGGSNSGSEGGGGGGGAAPIQRPGAAPAGGGGGGAAGGGGGNP